MTEAFKFDALPRLNTFVQDVLQQSNHPPRSVDFGALFRIWCISIPAALVALIIASVTILVICGLILINLDRFDVLSGKPVIILLGCFFAWWWAITCVKSICNILRTGQRTTIVIEETVAFRKKSTKVKARAQGEIQLEFLLANAMTVKKDEWPTGTQIDVLALDNFSAIIILGKTPVQAEQAS
jgi:hypothetical protein